MLAGTNARCRWHRRLRRFREQAQMDEQCWRDVLKAFTGARELPQNERLAYARAAVTDPEALDELLAMLARDDTAARAGSMPFCICCSSARLPCARPEWARLGQTFGWFPVASPLVAAAWGRFTAPGTRS